MSADAIKQARAAMAAGDLRTAETIARSLIAQHPSADAFDLFAAVLLGVMTAPVCAEALRLATGELPPYATQDRPDQGMALEIVRKSFANAGHNAAAPMPAGVSAPRTSSSWQPCRPSC